MKNFKFHWGHGMILLMLSFMIFILFMVSKINHVELVKEDYYVPDEIVSGYIQSQERYNSLPDSIKPKFERVEEAGLLLSFPKNWGNKQTKGRLELLRLSESKDDILVDIELDSNNQMLIPKEKLVKGLYQITLDFGQIETDKYIYRYKQNKYQW